MPCADICVRCEICDRKTLKEDFVKKTLKEEDK